MERSSHIVRQSDVLTSLKIKPPVIQGSSEKFGTSMRTSVQIASESVILETIGEIVHTLTIISLTIGIVVATSFSVP